MKRKVLLLLITSWFVNVSFGQQTTVGLTVKLPNYACCDGQTKHPGRATVTIPAGAHFISVTPTMSDGIGDECWCHSDQYVVRDGECHPFPNSNYAQSCKCLNSRMGDAGVQYSGNTAYADFYNWSDCCVRYAKLTATFEY